MIDARSKTVEISNCVNTSRSLSRSRMSTSISMRRASPSVCPSRNNVGGKHSRALRFDKMLDQPPANKSATAGYQNCFGSTVGQWLGPALKLQAISG